jgi:hypothetical protein
MSLYTLTDTTAAEKHHSLQEAINEATVELAAKAADVWTYRLLDTAEDIIYKRALQRMWGHVASAQVHGLDTITAVAVAVHDAQQNLLRYRGATSTSATSNRAEELEHAARLKFVETFIGQYNGVRQYPSQEYITDATLADAYRAHRDAIRAAEEAAAQAERDAHAAQYGAPYNAKGKAVTHQGVRAMLKKAGADVTSPYDTSEGVQVEGSPVRVRVHRSVNSYYKFTDEELAAQGYRWDGEGDDAMLVHTESLPDGTPTGYADGTRVSQAWYYTTEIRPDAKKQAAFDAEAAHVQHLLTDAGYVVSTEVTAPGEATIRVTGWAVQQ